MEPRPDAIDQTGQGELPVAPAVPPADDVGDVGAGSELGAAVASAAEPPPVEGSPAAPVAARIVGGSRIRWLIGGGIAVAAVAALVLAVTLLGARPLPEALKYVPADSAVVVELRPELPGDQREQLGALLARFPGFADQSILDQKIDEVLDRAVREGSGGSVDYATQVKPLLAGPMAISVSKDGLREAVGGGTPAGILLVATTDGKVDCAALGGTGAAAGTYRNVDLRWIDRAMACAIDGRFMLIGDPPAINGGLDARLDGRGLDGSTTYRAALATLDGDRLATVFVSGSSLAGLIPDASARLGLGLPGMEVPAWMIAALRAESDALVVDVVAAPVKDTGLAAGAPTTAPAGESRFAGVLPADTLGYAEVHGVGASLAQGIATLRADPAAAEAFGQVDAALALLGGADDLVGWIEEAGVAAIPTADGVGGALLVRGTDADATAARVAQVRNLLALAAAGTDITVRETEYGGATVTTVDLGDLGSLVGGLGNLGNLGDLGGLGGLGNLGNLGVPADVRDVRLAFSIASRDDLVLIAVGNGVAERILDVQAASSLETSVGYQRAMDLAGSRNNLQIYLALDAVIAYAEGVASGDDLAAWNRDLAPYAEHLAGVAWSSTSSREGNRARIVLTVK